VSSSGRGPADLSLVARLRSAGCVFAEDEAGVLVDAAASADELESMVLRRVAGEPLEVVVGWAEFCGLRIAVEPGVFVPRARTAVLVEHGRGLIRGGSIVIDLCCGTGAVGVALHHEAPGIELHVSDVDPVAVACARRNVEPIGGRAHEGDLFEALPDDLRGRVDLLVVNAPYVPTDAIATMPPEARDHEPRAALDGGADGVDVHRRVAAGAVPWLAPGGHLIVETSRHQSSLTATAFELAGLRSSVVTSEDNDGTAVVGTAGPATAR
jgi:release factor glutamine methyltransferase